MVKCTAVEAAKRLELLHLNNIMSAASNCLEKLSQIRQLPLKHDLTPIDKDKLERMVELIYLSFDIPYEVESLLLIGELEVISNLFNSVKKSADKLRKLGNELVECDEYDNEFYRAYATFCYDRS